MYSQHCPTTTKLITTPDAIWQRPIPRAPLRIRSYYASFQSILYYTRNVKSIGSLIEGWVFAGSPCSSWFVRRKSHAKVFVWTLIRSDHPVEANYHLPCHFTLYRNSTMASFSCIPKPLKCLRTVFDSWSLLCLRFSLRRAIVGEKRPMPGPVSMS